MSDELLEHLEADFGDAPAVEPQAAPTVETVPAQPKGVVFEFTCPGCERRQCSRTRGQFRCGCGRAFDLAQVGFSAKEAPSPSAPLPAGHATKAVSVMADAHGEVYEFTCKGCEKKQWARKVGDYHCSCGRRLDLKE